MTETLVDFLTKAKKPQVIVHPDTLATFLDGLDRAAPGGLTRVRVDPLGPSWGIEILTSKLVPVGAILGWDGAQGPAHVLG
jgi:hypothetical protein